MITWGTIPSGSTASIYWPQVDAASIVAAADQLYSTHQLSLSDAHTLQFPVTAGATYVPVPSGLTENVSGLFTITLPPTVKRGQEFNAVIRRLSSHQIGDRDQAAAAAAPAATGQATRKATAVERNWRYVVGTFQVRFGRYREVPSVSRGETYAILRWRLETSHRPADGIRSSSATFRSSASV